MDEVLKCVVFGRAARNTANIKSRQPIGKMFIKAEKKLDDYFVEIIEDELNIKSVEFKEDVSAFTTYSFKPQLKTVGPKYGKQLGGIREYLSSVDGNDAMNTLKTEGALKFTVVIDTTLTPELIEEGFVREIISKVQTMRKEADFNVMDKIKVYVSGNNKITDIMEKNAEEIKTVCLANAFVLEEKTENSKEWNINGEKVTLGVCVDS